MKTTIYKSENAAFDAHRTIDAVARMLDYNMRLTATLSEKLVFIRKSDTLHLVKRTN